MISCRGTESLWAEIPFPHFPTIDKLGHINVIVVGGGISGITTALLLQREGFTTALIEQDRIGSGETLRTSAHLTEYLDVGYQRLIADFGESCARLIARSKREAIGLIESLSHEAPCDFQRLSGFLYTEAEDEREALREQLEMARTAGLTCELRGHAPLPFPTAGAIEFPQQAQFHPGKYLAGLVRLYAEAGGMISEQSHVVGIEEEECRCRVRTHRGVAYANHVVAVTDAPITGDTLLETKLKANRTYVMALQVTAETLPHGLFWDTDDPYHYIRSATTRDGRVLIVGGEDHRTGTEGEQVSLDRLERFARERFVVQRVIKSWSGQILEAVDGLPFIGPREPGSHVYLASGYAGNGMTFGTVAAQILAGMIRGDGSEYAEFYAPTRTLAARQWAKYAAQNLPAALTLVSDWLPHRRADSLDHLQPGEGRVVRLGGHNVAASRDSNGTLHIVSPTCTHMGCDVSWNELERTWDCPCHGSRYGMDGHVIHGPATLPLEPVSVDALAGSTAKKE